MMKKTTFILIALFVVIVIGFTASLYFSVMNKKPAVDEAFLEKELTAAGIKNITSIDYYYGVEAFEVIRGTTADGQHRLLFIPVNPSDNRKETTVVDPSSGLSKNEVIQLIKERQNPSKILSVRYGIRVNKPLWEVVYLDAQKHLTYYYIDFKTGELIESYNKL